MPLRRGTAAKFSLFISILIVFLLYGGSPVTAQSLSGTGSAVELYSEGSRLLSQGRIYESIDNFKESVSRNPNYVDPIFGLAKAYFRLEEYEQALSYVRRARLLAKENYDIAALEGRIYTGLGNYEEAESLFQSLLQRQPFNRELIFGLAELHVAMGNIENALNNYRRALASDPYNRRGLLSAALLYAAQNKVSAAGELIQTAVDSYPEDSRVHAIAAEYYFQIREMEKAETHAGQAVNLDSSETSALNVLTKILFSQERFDEAMSAVETSIGLDRKDPLLWYLRGKAAWEVQDKQEALESFYTALSLRPSDEVTRMVMEDFLIRVYAPESQERRSAAEVRFEQGQAYERDNRIELARQEYRRGLILHPYSSHGRELYANTYKRTGNIAKYLSILEVLERNDQTTQTIRDEIEIYRNLREESVSAEWGIEQFEIDRPRYRFALFHDERKQSLVHLAAADSLREYTGSLMQGFEHIEIAGSRAVQSFAEAFGQARRMNADYFLLMEYRETERSFGVDAAVYNAATGVLVENFSSTRTGNNRVTQSMVRTVSSLADVLPVRGTIYRRSGNEVLLNIGSFQGLEPEDSLLVIRGQYLKLADTDFALEYPDDEVLGEITLTAVDDLLAEGSVQTYKFFDLINPGDMVFPKPEETDQENPPESEEAQQGPAEQRERIPPDLYELLLGIE